MYNKRQAIHFIGIAGVGMSGIAEVLFNLGYLVRGSDLSSSSSAAHLRNLGIELSNSHQSSNISDDTGVVVYSSAISEDNAELVEARSRGIITIPRAEMLAELMRMKYGVAVAGSHGKTTTTSIIGHILSEAELDPTVIVGGRVLSAKSGAKLGLGEYLVAEADESDGSFTLLRPAISIITNIDDEHRSHYGSLAAITEAFTWFAKTLPFYGLLIYCLDDPRLKELAANLNRRVRSYGFSKDADFCAQNLKVEKTFSETRPTTTFDLRVSSSSNPTTEASYEVRLPLAGKHMVVNSLAAIALAEELGVPVERAIKALQSYPGVARRMEVVYHSENVSVIDDYGHHPTEIAATINAIRDSMPKNRQLHCLFQPHRYSRTKELFHEFASCFAGCDELYITDIYPAGETDSLGVSGEALSNVTSHPSCHFIPREELKEFLSERFKAGGIWLSLGAGDIGRIIRAAAQEF